MCGITGTLLFDGNPAQADEVLLGTMRDSMAHRGPDGAGLWLDERKRIGLAHRRLSIIDLSQAANQPMTEISGRYTIVFNGEIYNHQQLRQELTRQGLNKWQTSHSDTEVILNAWRIWGVDCLERLRGMFAFALWDSKERELWLARDRIGIKPLYWSIYKQRLSFASEIKALLQDPTLPRALNEEAFFHYLSFLTSPAPQTLFAGINKLPAGHYLRIKANGQTQEKCWWDVWDHTTPLNQATEEELAAMLLDELSTSVRYRQVSDVPVGVFLSGGIDSSTNAALFAQNSNTPVKTFTIGYQGNYKSYRNETDYARMMAKHINADHHELLLTQDDLINFLPQMVWLQDEPIADPVCVPVYYVSKLARDNGVSVCQVGEGADELFCGYPAWGNAIRLARLNRLPFPNILRKMACGGAEMVGKTASNKYAYLSRASQGLPIFWSGAEAFYDHQKPAILHPRLGAKFKGHTSWEALLPHWQRFQEAAWEKSDLNWMTYIDLKLRLPELLLMRVDKMSMGVSLEGRVPFLDHKMVELALSIPASMKFNNGKLKSLLKKAVKGIIPDELINRPKQGFGVPVYEWCMDRLGQKMRTEIKEFCRDTEVLNWQGVEQLFNRGDGPRVWYLYNFVLWWQASFR